MSQIVEKEGEGHPDVGDSVLPQVGPPTTRYVKDVVTVETGLSWRRPVYISVRGWVEGPCVEEKIPSRRSRREVTRHPPPWDRLSFGPHCPTEVQGEEPLWERRHPRVLLRPDSDLIDPGGIVRPADQLDSSQS